MSKSKLKPRTNAVLRWPYVGTEVASAEVFKGGARMKFVPSSLRDRSTVDNTRGVIKSQSYASRMRCAFEFSQAECSWAALSTLTYLDTPPGDDVKQHVDALRRAWRVRWGESPCGWVMEFQKRGAVHFHLVHALESTFGAACMASEKKEVCDDGREPAEVVTGSPARWLVGTWLRIIGKLGCEKSLFVARRRMIEMFRTPDAAARYFAKDAAKIEQKELPEAYAEGLGRWWYLNRRWRKRLRATVDVDLSRWPTDWPLKHLWDARDIAGAVSAMSFPDGTPGEVVESAREAFPETRAESFAPRLAELAAQDSAELHRDDWENGHHWMPCACGALMITNRAGTLWGCACGVTKPVTVRAIQRTLSL